MQPKYSNATGTQPFTLTRPQQTEQAPQCGQKQACLEGLLSSLKKNGLEEVEPFVKALFFVCEEQHILGPELDPRVKSDNNRRPEALKWVHGGKAFAVIKPQKVVSLLAQKGVSIENYPQFLIELKARNFKYELDDSVLKKLTLVISHPCFIRTTPCLLSDIRLSQQLYNELTHPKPKKNDSSDKTITSQSTKQKMSEHQDGKYPKQLPQPQSVPSSIDGKEPHFSTKIDQKLKDKTCFIEEPHPFTLVKAEGFSSAGSEEFASTGVITPTLGIKTAKAMYRKIFPFINLPSSLSDKTQVFLISTKMSSNSEESSGSSDFVLGKRNVRKESWKDDVCLNKAESLEETLFQPRKITLADWKSRKTNFLRLFGH